MNEQDRRANDENVQQLRTAVAVIQSDITDLAPLPGAISKLNASIEVLNNTLKILGLVFSVIFPVLCGWNYYLGTGVNKLENITVQHTVQLQQLETNATKTDANIELIKDKQRK